MQLFVVGKFMEETIYGIAWEFVGVFDSEDKALTACTADEHFIGPAEMNARMPEETIYWPGCYYPNLENKRS